MAWTLSGQKDYINCQKLASSCDVVWLSGKVQDATVRIFRDIYTKENLGMGQLTIGNLTDWCMENVGNGPAAGE